MLSTLSRLLSLLFSRHAGFQIRSTVVHSHAPLPLRTHRRASLWRPLPLPAIAMLSSSSESPWMVPGPLPRHEAVEAVPPPRRSIISTFPRVGPSRRGLISPWAAPPRWPMGLRLNHEASCAHPRQAFESSPIDLEAMPDSSSRCLSMPETTSHRHASAATASQRSADPMRDETSHGLCGRRWPKVAGDRMCAGAVRCPPSGISRPVPSPPRPPTPLQSPYAPSWLSGLHHM